MKDEVMIVALGEDRDDRHVVSGVRSNEWHMRCGLTVPVADGRGDYAFYSGSLDEITCKQCARTERIARRIGVA